MRDGDDWRPRTATRKFSETRQQDAALRRAAAPMAVPQRGSSFLTSSEATGGLPTASAALGVGRRSRRWGAHKLSHIDGRSVGKRTKPAKSSRQFLSHLVEQSSEDSEGAQEQLGSGLIVVLCKMRELSKNFKYVVPQVDETGSG